VNYLKLFVPNSNYILIYYTKSLGIGQQHN
jgi:hypothetical protein